MGKRTLEFDDHKGFRCQRCEEWTLGGRLYSSDNSERICFLCHMDDVSNEMIKGIEDRKEVVDSKQISEDLSSSTIDIGVTSLHTSVTTVTAQKEPVEMTRNIWDADLL